MVPEQRILFAKEGKSKYISHLDLLRTIQRAFVRAGVSVKHSEGFNPHPKMSVALPLSVGHESVCEILDFALSVDMPLSELPALITAALPEGISVLSAYASERKIKELKWLAVEGTLEYDAGVPDCASERIATFFGQNRIVIAKRSKSGMSDFDIAPCIREISVEKGDGHTMRMRAVVMAQNPALNPENLINALRQLLPELAPDFTSFRRTEIYDAAGAIFR